SHGRPPSRRPVPHGPQTGWAGPESGPPGHWNSAYRRSFLSRISKKRTSEEVRFLCWRYLFSRPVSRQVSSAQVSLTSVFGMGTGGPSPQSTPTYFSLKRKV